MKCVLDLVFLVNIKNVFVYNGLYITNMIG